MRARVVCKHREAYNLFSNPILAGKESTMTRPFTIALSSGILCVAAMFVFSFPVSGQAPPEIESLALRTADRIGKTHQQHVFVAGLQAGSWIWKLARRSRFPCAPTLKKWIPASTL
jgi:hypothetical protein